MENNPAADTKRAIIIETFYGGSHKILVDRLTAHLSNNGIGYVLVTLPAKKWHWKARCGAMQIYDKIPKLSSEKVLWCSSVLNLAELLGIRSDLHKLRKIVYFHENQLIYPVQKIKSRDVQYGYNQIMTCLAADMILFNSSFNMTSFLQNINKITKLLPDNRPKLLELQIEKKCCTLYFPVSFPQEIIEDRSPSLLHIVWPHRWEFDKGPEDFFEVMARLKAINCSFKLLVLGEVYNDVPDVFEKAKRFFTDEILHFGFVESREEYFRLLGRCHVAVSTARHEFFGVSMLEAAYCGCLTLSPNSLVYPEIYPKVCLYSDINQLFDLLRQFCLCPRKATDLRESCKINFDKFSDTELLPKYLELMDCG